MNENTATKKLKHPSFPQPGDPQNERVWRYMSFEKLIDLMIRKQLFLNRIDLSNDSHEGSLTKINFLSEYHGFKEKGYEKYIAQFQENHKTINKSMFINCWHCNPHESEAMWKLYCPDDKGIVIQTTYSKLVDSIQHDDHAFIGCVTYKDYDSEWFQNRHAFDPVMHKRKAFEHEREVRIVKSLTEYWNNGQNPPNGIYLDWDLNKFGEKIYLNPYAPQWLFEVLKDILSKYDCQLQLEWSIMKSIPNY